MNVVSVMAHQDDELRCLGTMLKMRARGDSLHFICLTCGEMGMAHRPEMPLAEAAAVRDREIRELTGAIGATYQCLGYEDEFLYDTKEVRLALIEALRKTRADVIFTHNDMDYNLDHMTVSRLVRQCAMQLSFPMIKTETPNTDHAPAIFQCEPSGGFDFTPTVWVDISRFQEEKERLAEMHRSQDEAFISLFGPENGIRAWMRKTSVFRGSQVGVEHAEAFRAMQTRDFVRGEAILP